MKEEQMHQSQPAEPTKHLAPWPLFIRLIVFAFVFIIVYAFVGMGIGVDWEVKGQFGDMFGAATAVFSAMAFAGVVVALHVQQQELKEVRTQYALMYKEYKLTVEELGKSAKAQERSNILRVKAALLSAQIANITFRIEDKKYMKMSGGSSLREGNHIDDDIKFLAELSGDLEKEKKKLEACDN